jgi:hypothetical protein
MHGGRSLGKGSRRMSGRDGGARRRRGHEDWRNYVPAAARLETEIPSPVAELRFTFCGDGVGEKLRRLDAALSGRRIAYHIKSLGRTRKYLDMWRTARYRVVVSERFRDETSEVLRVLETT